MSTETTNKKIKIDNGTTFGKTYTDKAVDERLQGLVSTTTFTPVKEKANNSLQKPAGLTKTKLVGVGTNGQENIEIGDNLTLANGKLSATGGGGGGEGILYLHSIYLSNSVRNAVVVNVYNHSSTQFTIDSFKQWLSYHRYPCSGAISGGESQYIPYYIYYVSNGNSLACDAIDLANHSDIRVMIGSFSLTDYVLQVQ